MTTIVDEEAETDLDEEALAVLAELNQSFVDYEHALVEAEVVRGRADLVSLKWFPRTLLIEGRQRSALPHLCAKREQHKHDDTSFVSYVASLVGQNLKAIEEALGGQQVEPRWLAYLILYAFNKHPNLGRPGG